MSSLQQQYHHHHAPHTPNLIPPPQLLPDLRLALACLYNLPYPHQHDQQQQHLTLSQAQEFLIFVQSRNMRRKMESLIQRQRDKKSSSSLLHHDAAAGGTSGNEPVRSGSSWLASLALLCQQQQHTGSISGFVATNSERLFAAQTLLRRLIRSKMDQAIDWEIEISVVNNQQAGDVLNVLFQQLQNPLPLGQMVEHYQRIMTQYHPFVGSVVSQYTLSPDSEEDRVKGELSILSLTAIIYVTAVDYYSKVNNNDPQQQQNSDNPGPLLNTLGSAVAALALRLRFPTISTKNQNRATPTNQQQQQSPTLMTIVTQSLSLVFQTAATMSPHPPSSSPQKLVHRQASSDAMRACLSALPDIALGGTGGARGRMSIDPKALQEAGKELRTSGLVQLWDLLQQHVQELQQSQQQQSQQVEEERLLVHGNILCICEKWARFLPLPLEFLQHTVPLASRYITQQQQPPSSSESQQLRRAAFAYLVAIYEGATWTPDQILAKVVGVDQDNMRQPQGKKRQTSKAKKRQQEALQNRTTNTLAEEAKAECHHRGTMACHVTVMAWENCLKFAFQSELVRHHHPCGDAQRQQEIQIEGEGPIGCLAACANACLPHLLRTSTTPALAFPHSKDLFVAISEMFQQMCRNPHRVIRSFSMETIFSLHKALIQHVYETEEGLHPPLNAELQSVIVDFFFQCSMSLATSCGYPDHYFHNLGEVSDEELEIERNDVRDVIRTVAVSEAGGSTAFADVTRLPLEVTMQVLTRLLQACSEAVQQAQSSNRLFPETAFHCFSACAKPLNQLSKCYAKSNQPSGAVDILKLALHIFRQSLQIVIGGFPTFPVHEIFPASRVADLGIASLSPFLSNLCTLPPFRDDVIDVLRLSLNAAATSITALPELATPSVLGHQMYDIRGAMRGPGGEDHVGCLAIMRLSEESDALARIVIEAAGADIQKLCHLHSQLKSIEVAREKGVVHGQGVTPKSRRILLGVLCRLEIVSNGAAGCSAMLTELFNAAVTAIAAYAATDPSSLDDENVVFQICECTWDLAAFSPVIIESLFNYEGETGSSKLECLRVLTACLCRGYQRLRLQDETAPIDVEWNRLRAAFFSLLSASPSLPSLVFDSIEAINRAECEAINNQCHAGPSSHSSIFTDEVISADCVPCGLYLRLVQERLDKMQKGEIDLHVLHNCVSMLHKSKSAVLPTITQPCPDPNNFVDPRPSICEAWLLAMKALADVAARVQLENENALKEVLVESCVATISLLFFPVMSKRRDIRSQSHCMSFEGPHTLALNEFLASFFSLGPSTMQQVGHELSRRIPIDAEKACRFSTDARCHSVSIIGAALFRAAQGGLPPWSVESVPEVYASLFVALQKDVQLFGQMLRLAMEVRLHESPPAFGAVQPGQLLSGSAFDSIKESAKALFLQEAAEQCKNDNAAAWKRMKVLLKKLSGGKKTDTDFTQKPSPTKWEFERV